ncbi:MULTISPECIES: SRPBCC domain-containing protein [unclassified Cellulomonas]|uniref:SRPBCC family protein n=1 Tax=unclassified Cellulomonas TaxID=2620175 RepID=UPI0019BA6C0C|nr:SRPBCC domain-containing protein [Cellulomonas sp. ES6]MBD3780607.1 SRPBCC domain-containing protein [Micrococcales bacterium]WHP17130.1 SRPBCC domain-containing protein [Cellulomonas sp. ES6]
MTVVDTVTDTDALTLTIVSELAAPPERVWQVWADPRQLERWWGPPTWPATFTAHDLVPGGRAAYVMTGPDGEQAHGWWRVLAVDAPRSLELDDGFADGSGAPDDSMPVTRIRVDLAPLGSGTRMTIVSRFADAAQMAQVVAMGMAEGMSEALGQVDALLAEG